MLNHVRQAAKIRIFGWFHRRYSIDHSLVFFGTDDFSLTSLKALWALQRNENFFSEVNVVCCAKPHQHKKKGLQIPPVLEFSKKIDIKVLDWDVIKRNKSLDKNYSFGVVSSFGELIPANVVKQFSRGIINIHPSLLPRWRGAAPIIHTIIAGDATTGISFIKVSENKFDMGKILLQKEIQVPVNCHSDELRHLLGEKSAEMIPYVMKHFDELMESATLQNEELATKAPKVTKASGMIDFEEHSCTSVHNLQRGLPRDIGIRAFWQTKQVTFGRIVEFFPLDTQEYALASGTCKYNENTKLLHVKMKDGWFAVRSLQVEYKKEINATQFYNGYIIDKKTRSVSNVRFTSTKT